MNHLTSWFDFRVVCSVTPGFRALNRFKGTNEEQEVTLTGVTRGSGVAPPLAGTAERVPRLPAAAAVFAVVGHAPEESERQ